jgi:hypothetical protein
MEVCERGDLFPGSLNLAKTFSLILGEKGSSS